MSDALPTQADLDNIPEFGPEGKPNEEYMERFAAWAFIGVPGIGSAVMNMIGSIAKAWSKHLYKCGFRFHPELQDIKRQRPYRGQQHALNGLHAWVPVDTEEPDPIVIQDPVSMTVHEREAQVERLRYLGYRINEPGPEDSKAYVIDAVEDPSLFDPSEHTAMEVISYLRELSDLDILEKQRVVRKERQDRKRKNVLKRYEDLR